MDDETPSRLDEVTRVRSVAHSDVGKWVYGTVTVLAVVEVYRWTGTESYLDSYAVVFGPALAVALAHFYAEAIEAYTAQGGVLERGQLRRLLWQQRAFVFLTLPALAVLAVFAILDLDVQAALRTSAWLLVGLIALLTVGVSRARGLSGGRSLLAGSGALAAALVVIALQVTLKPH